MSINKSNYGSTPQHTLTRQIRDATERGRVFMQSAQTALANDTASSKNKATTSARAMSKNAVAIATMRQKFATTGKI
jgi:hypothetical protein